jgi:hypothetical protein
MGLTQYFGMAATTLALSIGLASEPAPKDFNDHIQQEIALKQQQEAIERQAAQTKQNQTVFEQLQAAQLKAAADAEAARKASPEYQAQLKQKQADDAAANRSILGGTMALLTGATLLKELEGVAPLASLSGKAGVFANEGCFGVRSPMSDPLAQTPNQNPVMAFLTPTPAGGT